MEREFAEKLPPDGKNGRNFRSSRILEKNETFESRNESTTESLRRSARLTPERNEARFEILETV